LRASPTNVPVSIGEFSVPIYSTSSALWPQKIWGL